MSAEFGRPGFRGLCERSVNDGAHLLRLTWNPPDDPRRIARHNRARRNVPGYDTAGADDGALSDGDAAKQSGSGTDGGATFDPGGDALPIRFRLQPPRAIGGTRITIIGKWSTPCPTKTSSSRVTPSQINE